MMGKLMSGSFPGQQRFCEACPNSTATSCSDASTFGIYEVFVPLQYSTVGPQVCNVQYQTYTGTMPSGVIIAGVDEDPSGGSGASFASCVVTSGGGGGEVGRVIVSPSDHPDYGSCIASYYERPLVQTINYDIMVDA